MNIKEQNMLRQIGQRLNMEMKMLSDKEINNFLEDTTKFGMSDRRHGILQHNQANICTCVHLFVHI